MKESIVIRVDDVVVFKPTPEGLSVWKRHQDVRYPLEETPISYLRARLDDQGVARLPFFKFVQVFGAILDSEESYCPTYFTDDIRIEGGEVEAPPENDLSRFHRLAAAEFERHWPGLITLLAGYGIELEIISRSQLKVLCRHGEYMVAIDAHAGRQELLYDIVTATDWPLGVDELVQLLNEDESNVRQQEFRLNYPLTWQAMKARDSRWKGSLAWSLSKDNELGIMHAGYVFQRKLGHRLPDVELLRQVVAWYKQIHALKYRRLTFGLLTAVYGIISWWLLSNIATRPMGMVLFLLVTTVFCSWTMYNYLNGWFSNTLGKGIES